MFNRFHTRFRLAIVNILLGESLEFNLEPNENVNNSLGTMVADTVQFSSFLRLRFISTVTISISILKFGTRPFTAIDWRDFYVHRRPVVNRWSYALLYDRTVPPDEPFNERLSPVIKQRHMACSAPNVFRDDVNDLRVGLVNLKGTRDERAAFIARLLFKFGRPF